LERLPEPTQSTVIIPEIAQEKPHYGKVYRVGPGAKRPDGSRRPMAVKVGDVVRYQSADVDTGTFVLIQEADILFIENA
jgi:chaperonin GroES